MLFHSELEQKEIEAENIEGDLRKLNTYKTKAKKALTTIFLFVSVLCIAGVSLVILLEINYTVTQILFNKELRPESKRKYWIYAKTPIEFARNGIHKHLHLVLDRLGYEKSTNETPWTLLWSFADPFYTINLQNLTANQIVNHFPGNNYISCKANLATLDSEYMPKAFRLPQRKNEFLEYAAKHQNTMFIQKNNNHRSVYLKNVSEIDMTSGTNFVQEYMQNPLLVDGYKFDIGVYVVLKSVNPLRVYWYKGDVLFRYCLEKYYPFDPKNLNKYVVGNDYLPTWKVPALAHTYTDLGNTMKETFDIYVRSMGKDPTGMWEDVKKAIAEVFITKEKLIVNTLKNYTSTENFFEMMRFDLIVDEDFKVYLLEANMSPNLSANHYPPNQLLYEQLLYNLFSLTGITRATVTPIDERDEKAAKDMISAEKNIAVFGDECKTICKDCAALELCSLCKPCLNPKLKKILLAAHSEFLHRGDFRRLIPPPMVPNMNIASLADNVKNLSPNNKLLHLWYQGKCNQDIT